MKLFKSLSVFLCGFSVLFILQGCKTSSTKPEAPEPAAMSVEKEVVTDLKGEWCFIKKRRVTKYTLKDDKLLIRSGRSGQLHEAALSCNEDYTECKAQTIRGWGSPVTEIMRLDGNNMNLTRIWGGAWKDKTYNFTYTRCPKW